MRLQKCQGTADDSETETGRGRQKLAVVGAQAIFHPRIVAFTVMVERPLLADRDIAIGHDFVSG